VPLQDQVAPLLQDTGNVQSLNGWALDSHGILAVPREVVTSWLGDPALLKEPFGAAQRKCLCIH
jgi:hypothetical protein